MIQFFTKTKHSDKAYFIYNAFRSWKVSWTWKEGDDTSRNHEQEKTEEEEEDVEGGR